MAITVCMNPNAAGFDPNAGGYEAWEMEMHAEAGHVISYEGMVLSLHERNGYDDIDFYAMVWDEAEGRVKSVEYATTRGWTYHNHAVVDASPEVRAKAVAWKATQLTAMWIEDAEKEIVVGNIVRSLTVRGKVKGVQGEVVSKGDGTYGPYFRVRDAVSQQVVFLNADRTEKVGEQVSILDKAEIAEKALYRAEYEYGTK